MMGAVDMRRMCWHGHLQINGSEISSQLCHNCVKE
jgi:hypothetical protein